MSEELYSSNPSMFKNNPVGFLLAILLIPVGFGLILLLIWHIQNKSSKLSISHSQILYEKGLLSKERSEISLSRVRATRLKQSFLNRMLGVGTIEIFTSGDKPEITAKGMPEPDLILDLIQAGQEPKKTAA